MNISKTHTLFFSATFSTKKIIRNIAAQFNNENIEYEISGCNSETVQKLQADDLLIVGVPVFSGRVPEIAVESIKRFKGDSTPAILICVYGNRDFDDTLIELKNIVCSNGFVPIAAASIVAQHSIFHQIASNRPDDKDYIRINEFCTKVKSIIASTDSFDSSFDLSVKGNEPYRPIKNIPIHPSSGRLCDKCGACAKLCPVNAIPLDNPQKTDKTKCISCGRCIAVCPKKTRKYRGLLYMLANWKFKKNYSERKEPDFFY